LDSEGRLDRVDWQLLEGLQENGRLSFSELGRRVGLTSPAVAERVRRMEDAGIISGYRAQVNLARVGRPLQAVIRVACQSRCLELNTLLTRMPEVLGCVHVTGDDCHVMRVAVQSSEQLERLLSSLSSFGRTTTSIILSEPLTHRVVTETESFEPLVEPLDGQVAGIRRVM
jgi:Lrp/AsnC family transcriptional regulator, leucine-responsive regulatory protein